MYCPNCGSLINDDVKYCPDCGLFVKNEPKEINIFNESDLNQSTVVETSTQKKPNKKLNGCATAFLVVAVCFVLLLVWASLSSDSEKSENTTSVSDSSENQTTLKANTTTTKATTTKSFFDTCIKLDFDAVNRNPEKFKGYRFYFTGKVKQVIEDTVLFDTSDNISYTLQVDTSKDKYGWTDDTVLVTYSIKKGQDRILEDDIIKVWGTCEGYANRKTILGAQVSLPEIKAEYIRMGNEKDLRVKD